MKKISTLVACLAALIFLFPLDSFAYGGGGGGGSAPSMPPLDSNTATSSLSSTISTTITSDRIYTRPLQLTSNFITTYAETETKTAELTSAEGSITLKPNRESTISVYIPSATSLEASSAWGGEISPPLLRSPTTISSSGESIVDSTQKLERDGVIAVVKVGSTTTPLNFSNNITMEIPIENVANDTPVVVYFSNDNINWQPLVSTAVQNGKVVFETSHLTYFAVSTSIPETLHFAAAKIVGEANFTDTAGHWAEDYINEIVELGIASGKSPTIYAPNDYITRAELTKMGVNAFGFDIPESVSVNPFSDVTTDAWYAPFIQAAKTYAIVQGYGDVFRPNISINRVEALKVLLEAADFDIANEITSSFSDTVSGSWYMKYVNFAKDNGIVSGYGDGTFGPDNPITRAEVSKVIIKILNQ